MSLRVAYRLEIAVRSPFLFQGLTNTLYGVDAAQLRDETGWPIIPADQVKGVLRAAMAVLADRAPSVIVLEDIARLFGKKSGAEDQTGEISGEQDRPERAAALFGDLAAELGAADSAHWTRIKIDDDLGAVESSALQVVELVAPFGKVAAFSGPLVIRYDDSLDRKRIEDALRKALALVPAIGAFKSSGFGEVVGEECSLVEDRDDDPRPLALPASGQEIGRFQVEITFDRPVIVDARRITDNLFAGSTVVPGAALKGAFAERLMRAGENVEGDTLIGRALAALRISHAFPVDGRGKRFELPVPNSVLHSRLEDSTKFGDALLSGFGKACLIDGLPGDHPIDWKSKVFDIFAGKETDDDWDDEIAEYPRTHVAIDADTLIAKDQALFSTISRGVLMADGKTKRKWRFTLDTGQIDDRDLAARLAAAFREGLDGVGRSSATASIDRFESVDCSEPEAVSGHGNRYAVTLITPAIMADPRDQKTPIFDAYRAYWKRAAGAELVNFFAHREMMGGYLAVRRRLFGSAYYPFVVTKPGSVFLLETDDPEKLKNCLRYGLPVASLSGTRTALNWRSCPFVPESGFGEIVCNLADHAALHRGVDSV